MYEISTLGPRVQQARALSEFHVLSRIGDKYVWSLQWARGPWSAKLNIYASFPDQNIEILNVHAGICDCAECARWCW